MPPAREGFLRLGRGLRPHRGPRADHAARNCFLDFTLAHASPRLALPTAIGEGFPDESKKILPASARSRVRRVATKPSTASAKNRDSGEYNLQARPESMASGFRRFWRILNSREAHRNKTSAEGLRIPRKAVRANSGNPRNGPRHSRT